MDVLFFAFANDPLQPLPTLQKEADEVFRMLSPGEMEQKYIIYFEPYATREKIAYFLTQYRERVVLFHFSGHAGRDAIWTREERSQAAGIARLLGQCPKLKLAFLNGCSTEGQVKALWEAGVPAVIATHSPVDDQTATGFSIRFYQALSVQDDVETALSLARGDAQTKRADLAIPFERGIQLVKGNKEAPVWGLFIREGRDAILQWRIPAERIAPPPVDFQPNQLLIDTLIEVLAHCNREVRHIKEDEEQGETVDLSDKRLAILNCMPGPVAEHLRKLMVPTRDDEEEGFDKVSQGRLAQLARTSSTIMELFIATMLSQLWEVKEKRPDLQIPEDLKELLSRFIRLNGPARNLYAFLPLIDSIRQLLNSIEYPYFFSELKHNQPDSPFRDACHFLDALQRRLDQGGPDPLEVPQYCRRGEESLAAVMKELGFLAEYTLTVVHMIDAVKFRHQEKPTFRHSMVRLVKVMGGIERKSENLDEIMYSRSVLLLKKENGRTRFLDLSPFLIDKYTFEKRPTEGSKLYFLYYYNPTEDAYNFRYAYKPESTPLRVSAEDYPMVKAQFDAFSQLIFGNVTMETGAKKKKQSQINSHE